MGNTSLSIFIIYAFSIFFVQVREKNCLLIEFMTLCSDRRSIIAHFEGEYPG